MLVGKKCNTYLAKLNNVIATLVQEGLLDVLSMCEIGGHQEGFKSAGINVADLQVLENGPLSSNVQNYLTLWNFNADASQPSVKMLLEAKVHRLSSDKCHPQLVVEVFNVHDKAKLVLGNLHIRTPHAATVSVTTRKRIVAQALRILESTANELQQGANDEASQPVVCALMGDSNLHQAEGEELLPALQPSEGVWDTVWQVHSTAGQKVGDIAFVKGANCNLIELPVGCSHLDRGVRNDAHDAFALQLSVRITDSRAAKKRPSEQFEYDVAPLDVSNVNASQLDVFDVGQPTTAKKREMPLPSTLQSPYGVTLLCSGFDETNLSESSKKQTICTDCLFLRDTILFQKICGSLVRLQQESSNMSPPLFLIDMYCNSCAMSLRRERHGCLRKACPWIS